MTCSSNPEPRRGLYRSRHGVIFGVCRGIADYLDFSVFWMRIVTIVLLFWTGVLPVLGIYVIAALLMKPEPVLPFRDEADEEFYQTYAASRRMAVHRLKRTYDNLDRRIRRIESIVTARDYDWDRRLNRET